MMVNFFVNDTARIIWDEETSIEKLLPSNWHGEVVLVCIRQTVSEPRGVLLRGEEVL